MTILATWAAEWGVSPDAIVDLQRRMGTLSTSSGSGNEGSEAGVSAQVRLAAARQGGALFRNNVGVLEDKRGIPVRFGLANDSKNTNKELKSGDLIGWTRVTVTSKMIGSTVAIFTSAETKHPGWRYTGTERERAQLQWAEMVVAAGGRALFISDATAL